MAQSSGGWSALAGCSPGSCSDEKHPARGKSREPGALTLGSFENGARFARLRPGAAYIEVLQLLERVVRAEFAVDEAMYNAPIPTVILNVAAQRFKHFRLHLAPSFLSAAQRAWWRSAVAYQKDSTFLKKIQVNSSALRAAGIQNPQRSPLDKA